jgi:hypothetical protein
LLLLLRIVLRLRGPKPEQRQGCCGVAVRGVESGERLAFETRRTIRAAGGDPSTARAPDSHPRWRLASVSGSGP